MNAENYSLTNDFVSDKTTKIKGILEDKAGEIAKASMKGKRNEGNRLIAFIRMAACNDKIIWEASEMIKALQDENENLNQIVADIQNKS